MQGASQILLEAYLELFRGIFLPQGFKGSFSGGPSQEGVGPKLGEVLAPKPGGIKGPLFRLGSHTLGGGNSPREIPGLEASNKEEPS